MSSSSMRGRRDGRVVGAGLKPRSERNRPNARRNGAEMPSTGTVTAMKASVPFARPAGTRPTSWPARSSTNENSPTCASHTAPEMATARGLAQQQRSRCGREQLDDHDAGGETDHQRQVAGEVADVEQHADRHEEGRREQESAAGITSPSARAGDAALRSPSARRGMHPAKSTRRAGLVTYAVPKQMARDGQQETPLRTGNRDTCLSSAGISVRATTIHPRRQCPPPCRARAGCRPGPAGLAAEQRHRQHHRDDRQVLEDEQGRPRRCPVCDVIARRPASTLSTMAVLLRDTSRPVNSAVCHSTPNAMTIPGDDARGEPDLAGAADHHQRGELAHPFEAELDAEGEQQQHHPDVGRLVGPRRYR